MTLVALLIKRAPHREESSGLGRKVVATPAGANVPLGLQGCAIRPGGWRASWPAGLPGGYVPNIGQRAQVHPSNEALRQLRVQHFANTGANQEAPPLCKAHALNISSFRILLGEPSYAACRMTWLMLANSCCLKFPRLLINAGQRKLGTQKWSEPVLPNPGSKKG